MDSFAQTYDLKAENWFPLEVGSYWHYEFSDGGVFVDTVVRHAEKDTLVNGQRWVKIAQVYCAGPNCISGTSGESWYRFTDDHYLLQEGGDLDVANADTVLATSPHSIFSVNVASDTLETRRAEEPMIVSIENNEMGNEADSTHLLLFARVNFTLSGTFIYKIGPAQSLVGAVVGDLNYGDTSLITSVALPIEDEPASPHAQSKLDIYPNPFHQKVSLRFQSQHAGLYAMSIYDVLGKRIHTIQKPLRSNEVWLAEWVIDVALPSSIYFIEVTRDGSILKRGSLIHVQ